jgi:hypothetical protein
MIIALIFGDYNTAFKRIVKHSLDRSIKVVVNHWLLAIATHRFLVVTTLIFNVHKLEENGILLISYMLNLFLVF